MPELFTQPGSIASISNGRTHDRSTPISGSSLKSVLPTLTDHSAPVHDGQPPPLPHLQRAPFFIKAYAALEPT